MRALCETIDLLPETARRLADPFFTAGIDPSCREDIDQFLSNPEEYIQEILEKLDPPHEAAVALVFAHSGRLPLPVMPTPEDEEFVSSIGATVAAVRLALGDLSGTLLRTDTERGHYGFRHPTVGDAYAQLLTRQPEKLVLWIRAAPLRQILSEATVNIDDPDRPGVAIPPGLHSELAGRLDAAVGDEISAVLTFLADRCSAEFAREHLAHRPKLVQPLTRPGMYLYSFEPGLVLVQLLHERGILPETAREEFAKHIAENAVDGPDPAWCTIASVRGLLTDSERSAIHQRVREALVTNQARAFADAWDTFNYPGTEWGSPETYVEPLRGAVTAMRTVFVGDDEALRALAVLEQHAEYLEERLNEDNPEYEASNVASRPPPAESRRRASGSVPDQTVRDRFDDVDR